MNKVTTRSLALALALTSFLAVGAVASAQPATDQERYNTMQTLHDEYMQKTDPIYQELFVKQNELNALMYQDKPDTAAVTKVSKEIAELNSKLNVARRNFDKQMREKGIEGGYGMGAGYGHRMGHGMGSGYGHRMGHGMDSGSGHRMDNGYNCPNYNDRHQGGRGYSHGGKNHRNW